MTPASAKSNLSEIRTLNPQCHLLPRRLPMTLLLTIHHGVGDLLRNPVPELTVLARRLPIRAHIIKVMARVTIVKPDPQRILQIPVLLRGLRPVQVRRVKHVRVARHSVRGKVPLIRHRDAPPDGVEDLGEPLGQVVEHVLDQVAGFEEVVPDDRQ